MKTSLKVLLIIFVAALTLGSISSCKPKLKEAKGVVTYIDANRYGDTVRSVKVLCDGDTLLFVVNNAKFTNGIMLDGDSVTIDYVKAHGDTLRAYVLYVHPKPSKQVDLDSLKNDKLLTR